MNMGKLWIIEMSGRRPNKSMVMEEVCNENMTLCEQEWEKKHVALKDRNIDLYCSNYFPSLIPSNIWSMLCRLLPLRRSVATSKGSSSATAARTSCPAISSTGRAAIVWLWVWRHLELRWRSADGLWRAFESRVQLLLLYFGVRKWNRSKASV